MLTAKELDERLKRLAEKASESEMEKKHLKKENERLRHENQKLQRLVHAQAKQIRLYNEALERKAQNGKRKN